MRILCLYLSDLTENKRRDKKEEIIQEGVRRRNNAFRGMDSAKVPRDRCVLSCFVQLP